MKLTVKIKFWLEIEHHYVFGEGLFKLLSKIDELGTLRGATKELGMSYRYAWGIIKKSEQRIGKPLLKTHKGWTHGKIGYGGAELTADAKLLIGKYLEAKNTLQKIDKSYEII